MIKDLRKDSETIVNEAISSCLPFLPTKEKLESLKIKGDIYLVAIGKAAFQMAKAAEFLNIKKGIVITKYNHIFGDIKNTECFEAGHPLVDENGINATKRVIDMCSSLTEDDTVLFLVSGGGSALFEYPKVPLEYLQDINEKMLKKGLDIKEINTIRKRLSRVKGGKFAQICSPAKVISLILSDVIGDNLDVIASGPCVKDESSLMDCFKINEKYNLGIDESLFIDDAFEIDNVENYVVGSVSILCENALEAANNLGYKSYLIRNDFTGSVLEEKKIIIDEINKHIEEKGKIALVIGGEPTVVVKGNGLGGRNQHLSLSLLEDLSNYHREISIISVGSDGTDGPADAAGGYVDSKICEYVLNNKLNYKDYLLNDDSYHFLDKIDCLIKTGPTGTNVNDVTIILIK